MNDLTLGIIIVAQIYMITITVLHLKRKIVTKIDEIKSRKRAELEYKIIRIVDDRLEEYTEREAKRIANIIRKVRRR